MKKIVSIGAVAASAPAFAHPGHGLHGIVGPDHPVAVVAFVVFSAVVLLAASWHSRRKADGRAKPGDNA